MSLCKQTERSPLLYEIKINSESIMELETWKIINFEILDLFSPLAEKY